MASNPNEIIRNVGAVLGQVFEVIDECLGKQQYLPAQMLMFAWLDVVSSLTRPENKKGTNKEYFLAWLRDYADLSSVGATPLDLYAARCGVLHTATPNSDLSSQGKAKEIAWTRVGKHKDALDFLRKDLRKRTQNHLLIDIDMLRNCIVAAFGRYLDALKKNGDLQRRLLAHGDRIFTITSYRMPS